MESFLNRGEKCVLSDDLSDQLCLIMSDDLSHKLSGQFCFYRTGSGNVQGTVDSSEESR